MPALYRDQMNRGAIETLAALKRRSLSINKGAALVACDSGTFSKILREADGRKPGRELANRIFAELGVGPELWDVKAKKGPNPKERNERRNPSAAE